jgi:RNA polymerase sigma factor (sigma-70 family)
MADDSEPKSRLDQITTRWSVINDPLQFTLRYAPAIRKYAGVFFEDPHDADDCCQDLLERVVRHGFVRASPDRGRFRDYLKKAVRNEAFSLLRRKRKWRHGDVDLAQVPQADEGQLAVEQAWLAEWQRCLLDRAWRGLERRQQRRSGNLFATVLRLSADHPEEDSAQLAARATQLTGQPLQPDAFRKQVSRARRLFAALLRAEVAQTLEDPTRADIDEELIEVGLMPYLRDFLPKP